MTLIDNLTDAADQVTVLQLPDGSLGTLELIFRGSTSRWTYNFAHPGFPGGAVNGQMLCVHPNILRNFKNLLSFGMACVTSTGLDPVNVQDFINGLASLFILNQADVAAVELSVYGIST